MKTRIIIGIAAATLSFLLARVQAQSIYTIKSIQASVLGTSTLHAWESEVTKIDCKGHFEIDHAIIKSIKNVQVKIPVEGIKSKEGKLMDSKTYEAFKYEANPYITYETASANVIINGSTTLIKATGRLTMAGTTREIELVATGKVLTNGDMEVELSKSLKMTDYNMKPPTAILGTIHVGDEVTIKVKFILTPSDALISTNSK